MDSSYGTFSSPLDKCHIDLYRHTPAHQDYAFVGNLSLCILYKDVSRSRNRNKLCLDTTKAIYQPILRGIMNMHFWLHGNLYSGKRDISFNCDFFLSHQPAGRAQLETGDYQADIDFLGDHECLLLMLIHPANLKKIRRWLNWPIVIVISLAKKLIIQTKAVCGTAIICSSSIV